MIFATIRGCKLMLINHADQLDNQEFNKHKQLCVRTLPDGIKAADENKQNNHES